MYLCFVNLIIFSNKQDNFWIVCEDINNITYRVGNSTSIFDDLINVPLLTILYGGLTCSNKSFAQNIKLVFLIHVGSEINFRSPISDDVINLGALGAINCRVKIRFWATLKIKVTNLGIEILKVETFLVEILHLNTIVKCVLQVNLWWWLGHKLLQGHEDNF